MSDFLEPIGNEEAILQNILGANNELLPPMSRNEKILLDILGEDYPIDPPMSRMEALLIALKEKIEHDTPSGKINITENGNDIDIAQYATADVNVSGGADLGTKSITENGTYAASSDNLDGYDEVTVNVPDKMTQLIDRSISGEIIDTTTTIIPGGMFTDCTHITGLIFTACQQLGNYTGGESVRSNSLFYNCTSVKKLLLPNLVGVKTGSVYLGIQNYTYSNMSNLKLMLIGNAGGNDRFEGSSVLNSSSLKVFIIKVFIRLSNTNAFDGSTIASGTGYIYVPDALVTQYKEATNWIAYASQIKGYGDAPSYASDTTYSIGDICKNGGKLYAWINETDGNSEPTMSVDVFNEDWYCVATI